MASLELGGDGYRSGGSLDDVLEAEEAPSFSPAKIRHSVGNDDVDGDASRAAGGKLQSLLRLFRSVFFNPAMAMMYLYKYPQEDVQQYLCAEMKKFPTEDLEFYLPQFLATYIRSPATYQHLRLFLVDMCSRSANFALLTIWQLRAQIDIQDPEGEQRKHATELYTDILGERPKFKVPTEAAPRKLHTLKTPPVARRGHGHRRTKSDVVTSPTQRVAMTFPPSPQRIAHNRAASAGDSDLHNGHAFDWPMPRVSSFPAKLSDMQQTWQVKRLGQRPGFASSAAPLDEDDSEVTIDTCLTAQQNFIKVFMGIGTRLIQFPKDLRSSQLYSELKLLNLNLPARVYLPLSTRGSFAIGSINGRENAKSSKSGTDHHVVRIPPQEAVILNSKDKVPYMVQVEVLDCDDSQTAPLPPALALPRSRHTRHSSLTKNEDGAAIVAAAQLFEAAAETEEATSQGCVNPADIRKRLTDVTTAPKSKFLNGSSGDQSAKAFKEPWLHKVERIRRQSPYGHLPNWRLISCIVKCGDDLRQEQLASQLLQLFQQTWQEEKLGLWLRPLRILVTASDGGLLEVVGSAISLHQAKKATGETLLHYFKEEYGAPNSEHFITAKQNFVESLAAYSLFCYFVQVKDRHNGNILIDGEGHILHIDFGFIFSNSPRNLGFETAPFKLTNEFLEVMGGLESDMFGYFKSLILQGFIAARKHVDRFVTLVEIMQQADAQLPCFVGGHESIKLFESRFQQGLTEEQLTHHVEQLIQVSLENMRTRLYDGYQRFTNGIL